MRLRGAPTSILILAGTAASGCDSAGVVDGILADHRFGALRSAWSQVGEAEGLSLATALGAEEAYSCAEAAAILAGEGASVTVDDGGEVGQVGVTLLGKGVDVVREGLFPVIAGLDELADGAVGATVVVQVFNGDSGVVDAFAIATEGAVDVWGASSALSLGFDVQTPSGAFTGELEAEPCDLGAF